VISINDNQTGPVAKKYYQAITDIQYGKAKDPMGWIVPIS
jgi:branched-chain amino acid aminotransferase